MSGRRNGVNTGIQTYKRPDGYWVARIEAGWTSKGTRYRPAVVRKTEAATRAKAREMLREYNKGGQDAVRGRNITVHAWAKTFDDIHISKLKPRVQSEYRSSIRKWIIPTIGKRPLSQLTPGDIRAVANAVTAAGNTSTRAAAVDRVLRTMLRKAEKEGVHIPRPVLLTDRPEELVSDRNSMRIDEVQKVLAHTATLTDGIRWNLALYYGLRQGEVLGLRWDDDIDFENNQILIQFEHQCLPYLDRAAGTFNIPKKYTAIQLLGGVHLIDVKSKAGFRILPMLPTIKMQLLAWRKIAPKSPHALVFPRDDGQPRNEINDRQDWKELQQILKITHPTGRPYDLHEARHTTATILHSLGVPMAVQIAILGHAKAESSEPYTHALDSDIRDALTKVANTLEGTTAA